MWDATQHVGGMSTESTPADRRICTQDNPGAASPTMGYSTLGRTRPALPRMGGAANQASDSQEGSSGPPEEKMEDLPGVLQELSNTDFVSKYSRRTRASGTTSPSLSCCSPSMSQMSPVMSPGTKSPPNIADGRGTITLKRMPSIKLKLEQVKESQDRAEQAGHALRKHKRRSGVTGPPPRALHPGTKEDHHSARLNHKPLQERDQSSRSADSTEGRLSSSEPLLENGASSHMDGGGVCDHETDLQPISLSAKTSVSDGPCIGSVPSVGSVPLGVDLHAQRAWSEPSYLTASRRDNDEEELERHSYLSPRKDDQYQDHSTDGPIALVGHLGGISTIKVPNEKAADSESETKGSVASEGSVAEKKQDPPCNQGPTVDSQPADSTLMTSAPSECQPECNEKGEDTVSATNSKEPLAIMKDEAPSSPNLEDQKLIQSSAVGLGDPQSTIHSQRVADEEGQTCSSTEDMNTCSTRISDTGTIWTKPCHSKSKSLDMTISQTFNTGSCTPEKVSNNSSEAKCQTVLESRELKETETQCGRDLKGKLRAQETSDKCSGVEGVGETGLVGGVHSALEAEDEGVGGDSDTETESSTFSFRGVLKSTDVTSTELDMTEAPSGEGTGKEDQKGGHFKRLMEAGGATSGNGKMANGRFLTHPPVRERSAPKEIGSRSVDSNGLGSLREGSESVPDTGELTSQVSMVSIDTSETTESPTYGDVVIGVMAEGNDVDKFERRNSKSLKQKSKSDPSGEKQKLKESTDLPGLPHSSTQSTPVLADKELHSQKHELKTSEKDRPISKSDNVLISQPDTGSQAKLSSEDSFEESPKPLQRQDKQSRKAFKIRHRDMNVRLKRDGRNSKLEEEASQEATSEDRVISEASLATSIPETDSPLEGIYGNMQIRGLVTVPGVKKPQNIVRSQSSASVFSGGARPKDLKGTNSPRPIRPAIPGPLGVGLGVGGSEPELSRSKLRERHAGSFFPRLEPIISGSTQSLLETPSSEKEKRDHIVEELVSTEEQYVETLHMLVEKYMIPMKNHGILDSNLVDDIFYKINEIFMHHAMFYDFLEGASRSWDAHTTIGDVIHNIFSRESVIECYVSFIENFPRAEKVLDDLSTKGYFSRFLEQCERETKSKLPLKAQIVKPAQRIPRYELLLRRLIENTGTEHPDYKLLLRAEEAIHHLALRINNVKESKHEEDLQETLRKLELLLITDLVAPERLYHRHDMVQVLARKDQCCMWLFSDLVVLTSIKRKSGPVNRRSTILLQSPSGQDFVENIKHKVWLKVPLDDLDIVKGLTSLTRKQLVDRQQLDDDFALLAQIADLSAQLQCPHQSLDEAVLELRSSINRQLSEHQLKAPPPDACKVELMATLAEGVANITVVFPSQEKKLSWESAFVDAKQKLATLSDCKPPEFLQALQITKTRAGMQFSCAAPIDGLNASQYRDVWVCNSDGYVGHMCLLSLQPEPIVTLNTPVPGCNSRILCICAVPAFHSCKRRASIRPHSQLPPLKRASVTIHVTEEEGTDSTSTGTDDASDDEWEEEEEEEETTLQIRQDFKPRSRSPSPSQVTEGGVGGPGRDGAVHDPLRSTMWLGTEDGCIHIFLSTDNIKTTKNKVKMQQNAGVLCIVHLDQKAFVSLANGDIVVYQRGPDGVWDTINPSTVTLGDSTSPVTRMLPVAGRLWCACHCDVIVLNPATLETEHQFPVNLESKRSIQCLANSGQGVWLAGQGSSKVILYHATTYEHLLDVSIAQAVAQKLQTADDIIRQHKTACLRITALLACKDLLWVGTSAGVVLTLPMPKVSASTVRGSLTPPTVTGLVHGHTGHVRFLTTVELPPQSKRGSACDFDAYNLSSKAARLSRRASLSIHMLTMATKMLVISGGDGYEDFRNNSANETAGRDDSTNHLLLWQV